MRGKKRALFGLMPAWLTSIERCDTPFGEHSTTVLHEEIRGTKKRSVVGSVSNATVGYCM